MANVTMKTNEVNFDANRYHVMLYGINHIDSQLEDYLRENILFSVFAPEDSKTGEEFILPWIYLRKVSAIKNKKYDVCKKDSGGRILESRDFSHIMRFMDGNTLEEHFELVVDNGSDYDKSCILASVNLVACMLRVRGFKFITPLITSMPYARIFDGDNISKVDIDLLEDAGINETDFSNRALELEDLQWIQNNIYWYFNQFCLGNNEFELPIEMLYASIFSSSPRTKIASLFSGIDALIKTPPNNISKIVIKSLQVFGGISRNNAGKYWGDSIGRNKMIHGVKNTKSELEISTRINDVRDCFCKMLQYFIERQILPNIENITQILEKYSIEYLDVDICPHCEGEL